MRLALLAFVIATFAGFTPGQSADATSFRKAAEAALQDAKPQSENGFKIELAKRCLAHALHMAATG